MTQEDTTNAELLRLVRQAQEGDTNAFSKIYDHYFTPVYRYTALRVSPGAAEDLVADIFVKAWEKLYTYKERKKVPFGAWLFRIARNEVIDAYRTGRTWDELPQDMRDPDELNMADTSTKKEFALKTVCQAMEKLPNRYREVLNLAYLAGLPNAEVARVLRISEGSVRILKFRALNRLRDLLPPEFQENM